MSRPVYVPTVAEAVLAVDRSAAWTALLDELDVAEPGDARGRALDSHTITETAISVERPWRLVLDVTGGPGDFHQESVVLVPHADGCLGMWSALVIEPTDDASQAYADAVAAAVPGRLEALVDRLS